MQEPHPQPLRMNASGTLRGKLYTGLLRWETLLQHWFTAREEGAIMYT